MSLEQLMSRLMQAIVENIYEAFLALEIATALRFPYVVQLTRGQKTKEE